MTMAAVLEFSDVSVVRDGNRILDSLDWTVESDQRWVILGPNGAGKTTLLQVASATIHPTSGTATAARRAMGKIDVFELRPRIGFASTAMARRIPGNETVLDVVMTAAYSVTGRWNEEYEDIDVRRALPRARGVEARPPRGPDVRHPVRRGAEARADRPRRS